MDYYMKSRLPVKKLIRFNFWLVPYFMLFGFVTSMVTANEAWLDKAIQNAVIGGIILGLNAYSNLALIVFLDLKFNHNKKRLRKIFLISSHVLSYLIFVIVIVCHSLIFSKPLGLWGFINVLFISIMVNGLVIFLQNFIIVNEEKVYTDIENAQLKAANADAANQLLRQQIHPHFLFNALNVLKSLYKVNPHAGEEYLIRLSDFLRAAVSNNNTKVIPLKEEIKFCVDYLEMQKIRFGKALNYSISISDSTLKSGYVPSFSIQPLLENAIKHNELTEESPLSISIEQEGDRIKVLNNLQLKNTSENSAGSGLTNLSERYKILANDDLIIENTNDTFFVSIKILSHDNSNHRG